MDARGYGRVVLTLNHVSLPSETISNPPSISHGLTMDDEKALRWLGCELIQKCCILLHLPTSAAATAQSLFHRFFYRKSFTSNIPWKNVAMASVILASRIEEEPRRFRDIINVENALIMFENNKKLKPVILDEKYTSFKQELIDTERKILKELGFAVFSQFPHKIIILYLQTLMLVDNSEIVQSAWNFMNDCQRTDILVRFSSEEVAMACIDLATRQYSFDLPTESFFKIIRVDARNVEKAALEIVRMYSLGRPEEGILSKLDRLKTTKEMDGSRNAVEKNSLCIDNSEARRNERRKQNRGSRGNSEQYNDRRRERRK